MGNLKINNPTDILQSILQKSNYDLSLFSSTEQEALCKKVFSKKTKGKEKSFIKCVVRDKEIQLKPEEIVRQLYATRLIEQYGYPKSRLAFEYKVAFGSGNKSADIVISDKDRSDVAYMVVELKNPNS